ncbi:MAG: hypothetical protein J7J72_09960 [Bacteroidales bacterium]|nr:hypothetical protein [Bacteroidales bacterium]
MNITFRFITFSILIISTLIGIPNKVIGQELITEGKDILALSNSIYRSDDRLLNGKYYVPRHYFAEGHPYFLSNEWVGATLFIKGIQYNHVPLKYNIEDDNLIIKSIYENRISKDILMHNSFVDSLIIGKKLFHNTSNQQEENAIGFAELVYRGKNAAYLKHTVEFKDELSDRLKFGKYLPAKRYLYLFDGTSFFLIQKKKDLIGYFPNYEKEIKLYLRKKSIRLRKASTEQIVNLIQFCEQQ